MEILAKIGIKPGVLIAQIINFLILVIILYKLAYKPVLNLLKERSDKISKSMKHAEEVEKNLKKTEEDYENKMKEAYKEAQAVLEKARKEADENRVKIIEEAKMETDRSVNKAKTEIAAEKDKMLSEAKKELSELLIMSVKKVVAQGIDEKADNILVEQIIKGIDKK